MSKCIKCGKPIRNNRTICSFCNGYMYGYEKGRADVIDLIDRHLWNYSHEVWEDFKPFLEQLKG